MGTDADLILKIIQQLRDGNLPDGSPLRMYGACGDEDAICDVCGLAIGPSQVLYEIVYDGDGTQCTLTAHLHCHELWRQALREAN